IGGVAKRVGISTYWIHKNHQGSVDVETDSSGTPLEVQRLKYFAYGDRLSTSTTFAESESYTGQRQDETGLFYLHTRYYDPKLARFISADSVTPNGQIIGLNRYAYCNNSPVLGGDPSGHDGNNYVFTGVDNGPAA